MSSQSYKDYPQDTSLFKEKVSPGHGIIGCEMHEINGWGTEVDHPKKPKKGLWTSVVHFFFGRESDR